jgi:hypothetical protein
MPKAHARDGQCVPLERNSPHHLHSREADWTGGAEIYAEGGGGGGSNGFPKTFSHLDGLEAHDAASVHFRVHPLSSRGGFEACVLTLTVEE